MTACIKGALHGHADGLPLVSRYNGFTRRSPFQSAAKQTEARPLICRNSIVYGFRKKNIMAGQKPAALASSATQSGLRGVISRWGRTAASVIQNKTPRRQLKNHCILEIKSLPRPWTPRRRRARYPCEPVSVNSRTGLRTAETEIGKSPAETGARNLLRKSRNARNCRPETGAPQPNLRKCRRFSPTGK
jgi:hypothetical protein